MIKLYDQASPRKKFKIKCTKKALLSIGVRGVSARHGNLKKIAVGQCNYYPPVIRNPHVVHYLRGLGIGLVSLISGLGNALGVVGSKKLLA